MNHPVPTLPEACLQTLEAIQRDPLDLAPEHLAHLRHCHACAEARVMWLAQEEAPVALTPAGYHEALPHRILAKLPPPRRSHRRAWWLAAAGLAALVGTGGFLAGRATRAPQTEATLRATPETETLPPAPFQDADAPLASLPSMTEEEAAALVKKIEDRTRRSR